MGARLDANERYGLRVTLLAVATVLVAVPFATLLFQVIARGSLTRFDGRVADELNDAVHEAPGAVRLIEVVTWLGTPAWFYALVAATMWWVWRRGRRRLVVFLFATTLGGGIVNTVVKLLVDRPRPVVDHPVHDAFGRSFPSGHSMSSVVCYGAILLVVLPNMRTRWARRAAVASTVVLCLAIGTSRLLLGVHFVTDVAAGFVLGAAWLIGAVGVFQVWRAEEGREPAPP